MIRADPVPSARAERTNRLAIAALICGIVQLCGLFPLAIVAVILGHLAKRQIRRTGERGHGQAQAGLVLGYLGIGLLIVVLVGLGILRFGYRTRLSTAPGRPRQTYQVMVGTCSAPSQDQGR
jgi:hypothetical protein